MSFDAPSEINGGLWKALAKRSSKNLHMQIKAFLNDYNLLEYDQLEKPKRRSYTLDFSLRISFRSYRPAETSIAAFG